MFGAPQPFPLTNGNFLPPVNMPSSTATGTATPFGNTFAFPPLTGQPGAAPANSFTFPPISGTVPTAGQLPPSFNTQVPTFNAQPFNFNAQAQVPSSNIQPTSFNPQAFNFGPQVPAVQPTSVNTQPFSFGAQPSSGFSAQPSSSIPLPTGVSTPFPTATIPFPTGVIPLPTGVSTPFSAPLPTVAVSSPVPVAAPSAVVPSAAVTPAPAQAQAPQSAIWTEEHQRQWVANLQGFIYQLLQSKKVVPDKLLPRFVDAAAMPRWISAYTDVSYSADDNYDQLEYYGDRVLETGFAKYLIRNFPGISEGQLTNLKSYYMSKMQQSQIAQQLGMPQQLRMRGNRRAHLNLYVDVFESTFGALATIGDSIVEGMGAVAAYNLLKAIFDNIQIDVLRGGAPRTQVEQFFSRFDMKPPVPEETDLENGSYQSRIILQPFQLTFLNSYLHNAPQWTNLNLTLRDPVIIADRTASTQVEATNEAFVDALQFFNGLGITTDWARGAKRVYDKSLPGIAEYVAPALQKSGFKDIYFDTPNKWSTKTIALVQLIGTNDDGAHQQILGTLDAPQSERRRGFLPTKQKLIQDYVNGVVNE